MQIQHVRPLSSLLKFSVLPLLVAVYPAVFHYGNNAHLVTWSSFVQLAFFLAGVGLLVYLLPALTGRGTFPQRAVAASLILLFFHTYGPAFDGLRRADLFQVENYNFMPFWVFSALYGAWAVMKLGSRLLTQVWSGAVLILGGLIVFNAIQIAPVAWRAQNELSTGQQNPPLAMTGGDRYPDIYYLVFDEAAGFEAMRQYWKNDKVDSFVAFLEAHGFYVAENSRSRLSTGSMYQRTVRLNYEEYPVPAGRDVYDLYNSTIGDNRVMRFLKEHGYTLIAYDEMRYYLTSLIPLPVDHLVETSPREYVASGFIDLDDYKRLVLNNTLLRPVARHNGEDPQIAAHRDMILYTIENAPSVDHPAPRFVYVHLMLPHVPFVFRENGELQLEGGYGNWDKYLQNYMYFLRVARQMVENILAHSDPANPPVIIVQSDHGARNNTKDYTYSNQLENYPEEHKNLIVNALYLPGCEDAPLKQDLNPASTFPIVFNCYFDADIPLE